MKNKTKETIIGYGVIAGGLIMTFVGFCFTQRTSEELELEEREAHLERAFEAKMSKITLLQERVLGTINKATEEAEMTKSVLKEMKDMTKGMSKEELETLEEIAKGNENIKTMDYLASEIMDTKQDARRMKEEMRREARDIKDEVRKVKIKLRELDGPDYIVVRR